MRLKDALLLGRISNLPTVWSNALAGLILASPAGVIGTFKPAFVVLAMSLFYVGGTYLNDAFDADFDAVNRPERPIPSGRVARSMVFATASFLLACAVAATLVAARITPPSNLIWSAFSGTALLLAIVTYDWKHKSNPYSPLLIALCRTLVYVTAALCVAFPLAPGVFVAGTVTFTYLIGLSYVAKQENLGRVPTLWPLLFLSAPVIFGALNAQAGIAVLFLTSALAAWICLCLWLILRGGRFIPLAVGNLIAGIALCDALFLTLADAGTFSIVAVSLFVLTIGLQRFVPGS